MCPHHLELKVLAISIPSQAFPLIFSFISLIFSFVCHIYHAWFCHHIKKTISPLFRSYECRSVANIHQFSLSFSFLAGSKGHILDHGYDNRLQQNRTGAVKAVKYMPGDGDSSNECGTLTHKILQEKVHVLH